MKLLLVLFKMANCNCCLMANFPDGKVLDCMVYVSLVLFVLYEVTFVYRLLKAITVLVPHQILLFCCCCN